jgi:uncharacterized protein (DUF983 family)
MLKKGSKIYSISKFKCPGCHEGNLFKTPLSSFKGIYNMHDKCIECGEDFQKEPGFYWGAMYIGYMLSTAYMLSSMFSLIFFLKLTVNQSFVVAISGGVLIVPVVARLARSIWIHIYVRYKGNKSPKNIKKS